MDEWLCLMRLVGNTQRYSYEGLIGISNYFCRRLYRELGDHLFHNQTEYE